jgi:hypothetical protein
MNPYIANVLLLLILVTNEEFMLDKQDSGPAQDVMSVICGCNSSTHLCHVCHDFIRFIM